MTTMLRKLRRRSCSRRHSELAARTVATILPRSFSIVSSLVQILVCAVLAGWMIRIVDADASGDPLELLSSRVSRTEMTLHVPEQGWHLTKYVVRRREVEELSLCGVEVARRPLDKRPIAEDPEPLARLRRLRASRLPGRVKVTLNRRHQSPVAISVGTSAVIQSHNASSS